MVRLRGIAVAILVCLTLLFAGMPSPALAAPGDETTPGSFTLASTYENISVYVSFSGDNNANNSALLEYRTQGSGSWIRGMDMVVDRRATLGGDTNTYRNQWRASIIGLDPNTDYDVRVTFSDGDGVSGTNPRADTVTTRNDDFDSLSYTGNLYYVNGDTGSDSNPGTLAEPFETIQAGVDAADSPGDTVYIMETASPYVITSRINCYNSGNSSNYITIRNYGIDSPVLDFTGNSNLQNIYIRASYVRLKGIEVYGGNGARYSTGIWVGENTPGHEIHDVIIEECTVTDDKTLQSTPYNLIGILLGATGDDNVNNTRDITVINNTVTLVQPTTSSIGLGSGPGIQMQMANGGHVIQGNNITFTGTMSVHGQDGINNNPNWLEWQYTMADTDICYNTISGATDDGISLDGNGSNVRVWGNTITRANIAISAAPIVVGPTYVYRNVAYDLERHWVTNVLFHKGGEDGTGYIFYYHNTIIIENRNVGPKTAGASYYLGNTYGDGDNSENVFTRNNIIVFDGYLVTDENGRPDMDYDMAYKTGSGGNYYAKWGGTQYNSFSAFQSTTREPNGFEAMPVFVNRANGDFRAAAGSAGIDVAVVIPGFNDANSRWPYQGSAPDMGAYEYSSGPPVDNTPPYTSGHNPADGATGIARDTNIVVHVRDDGAGVDQDLIVMHVEGLMVTPTITGTPSDYTLTYDPPADFDYEQVVDVTIDARDLDSSPNIMAQDACSFTIASEFNNVPELSPVGNKQVGEEATLQFTVTATDTDGPSPLSYSASNLPSGASFDTETQVFSWTPSYTQAGTYSGVHFEVTDGQDTDSEDITITVTNTNRPPLAEAGSDQDVTVSSLVTLNGSGSSDPDNDPIDYAWTQTGGPTAALADNTTATPTFTPTEASTYMFSLVVNDGILNSNPDSVTITATQWPYLPVRVNSAGADYTDGSANTWTADQSYVSGLWGFYGDDNTVDRGAGHAISGTGDDRIYQTERYGLSGYRFDLGNGTYDVNLHFAETYSGITGSGQRVFDVIIEGQLVLDNLDMFSEIGHSTALIKTINNITVTDGQLTIEFTPGVEVPLINGIEIFSAGSNNPPVLDSIGDKSINEGQLLQFTISATDSDNDQLTYSASNLPQGANFNSGTRIFSWTPGSGQAGSYSNAHFEVSDGSLADSEDLTITVAAPASPPPSGGPGGGGGGGGGGGSSGGFTSVSQSTTSTGSFMEDINAKSVDRKVELIIPQNTIGLNRYGCPLTSVSIKERTPRPKPPPDGEIVSEVYEIGPNGATFDPAVALVFNYDDAEVPQGVAEKNLVLAMYDWDTEQWQDLDSAVDPEINTVKTRLNHLSTYAVLAYTRPASFTVTNLSVSSEEIDLGSGVNISGLITNIGDLTGSYEISLKLDDVVVQTREVTIDGGDSEAVIFGAAPDTAGEHKAVIGDSLVIFTVKVPEAPAVFTLGVLNITPTEINPGDRVAIEVLVTNTGDLTGSYEAILQMDDVVLQTKEVTLDGGASVIISFNLTPDRVGEHTVKIGGLLAVFEVETPQPVVEELSSAGPGISDFSVIPIYDSETGKLISARIDYQIHEPEELTPENTLALKVFYADESLADIPPLSLSQLQSDGNTGSFGYIPSSGWRPGIYTFQAELYEGMKLIQSTDQQQFTVTPESITRVFSWKTLGIVVGTTFLLSMVILATVLYRRRNMLGGYLE